MTTTPDDAGPDPWANPDSTKAAVLAATHLELLAHWEEHKRPGLAQALVNIADEREQLKHDTGWTAQYEGNDVWTFTYNDPSTRERAERPGPVIIRATDPNPPKEDPAS